MATLSPQHRFASARPVPLTAAVAWVAILGDVLFSRVAATTVASSDNDAEFDELWAEVFGPWDSPPPRYDDNLHGLGRHVGRPASLTTRQHRHRASLATLGTTESFGFLDKPAAPPAKGPATAAHATVAKEAATAAPAPPATQAQAQAGAAAAGATQAVAQAAQPKPFMASEKEDAETMPPHALQEVYPRTHPIVSHTLEHSMEDRIVNLNDRAEARKEAQQRLASASNEALARMNDAVALQRTIKMEEAEIRMQDSKLQGLEEEEASSKRRHDELIAKVRAIVEPRVLNMEERVEQRKEALEKAQADVKEWTNLIEKYKSSAVGRLEDRNHLKKQLQDAEDALDKAQQAEAYTTKMYQKAKNTASREVEIYKYAYAHFEAKRAHMEAQQDATNRETTSLEKMRSILKMQEHRIDSALDARKDHLQQEVRQTSQARDAAAHALQLEKKQFAGWKVAQRERVEDEAKKREEYEAANKAFTDERAQTLNNANAQAGRAAENSNDWAWDDWAWDGSGGDPDGEEDEKVSFDE